MKFCVKCFSQTLDDASECAACMGFRFTTNLADISDLARKHNLGLIQNESHSKSENLDSSKLPDVKYDSESVERLLREVVQAQNRTTHAVRAFVRFLFIQLTGITLAGVLWTLSNLGVDVEKCALRGESCTGSGLLQFLAVVTWLIGVAVSSYIGSKELEKSSR